MVVLKIRWVIHAYSVPNIEKSMYVSLQRKESVANSSIASDADAASVDSAGEIIPERKGRDEDFEALLEKYSIDEIEEKPKHFYSYFCNRWLSIFGVR